MKRRCAVAFIIMTVLLVLSAYVNLITGTIDMTVRDVFAALFGRPVDEMHSSVIMTIRLPRIAAAVILGGALALSGYMLQTFFDNPIVGPFVLGISSGAKLMVALFLIFFMATSR